MQRQASSARLNLPRLPVLGWTTFSGPRKTDVPTILDQDRITYTTSGRAAIVQALRILGVRKGDRILVPTYHCPTMIAPVSGIGAEPQFYPLNREGGVHLDYLEKLETSGTKAILATHFFGIPQQMAKLRRFCDMRGIYLIEDCAHSLFGETDGRAIGCWGDAAIASLTKFLPVAEGGCLVSTHSSPTDLSLGPRGAIAEIRALIDAVERAAQYGKLQGVNTVINGIMLVKRRLQRSLFAKQKISIEQQDGYTIDYRMANSAMTGIEKWIVKASHKKRIVEGRRRNYAAFANLLAGSPGIHPLFPILPPSAVPYVFPLWVDDPERIYQKARSIGVPIFRWDQLWPNTPILPDDVGLEWSTHIFQLACHQDLSENDISLISQCIHDALRA